MIRLRSGGETTLNTRRYLYNQGHQRTRQTQIDTSYATYTFRATHRPRPSPRVQPKDTDQAKLAQL